MRRLFLNTALAAALCLSASGAAACDISIGDSGFNIGMATNKATETWTRSYAVSAGGTFEVENTNGLIRRFFPKHTRFDSLPLTSVVQLENWLNDRPRKVLNYQTPREAFQALSVALAP